MQFIEKWWGRALISLALSVMIGLWMDTWLYGLYGVPFYSFVVLYIGLSVIYGFSNHNRSKKENKPERDDIID